MLDLRKYVSEKKTNSPVDFGQFSSQLEESSINPQSFGTGSKKSGLGNTDVLAGLQEDARLLHERANATEALSEEYSSTVGTNVPDDTIGKIRLAETGSAKGKYDTVGEVGDGAGLSIGAYQFTEKSGQAKKLANMLGFNDVRNPEFHKSLSTPIGKKAQDDLFVSQYKGKPDQYAKQYGIKDPKTYGFMLDTNLNGGLDDVMKRASEMEGGIILSNLIKARGDRYNTLIEQNPKQFGKFRDTWNDRLSLWK